MDFWGEEISGQNFTLIAKKIEPIKFSYYRLAYPIVVAVISAAIPVLSYFFTDDIFTTSGFTNGILGLSFSFLIIAILLQFRDYFSNSDILENRSKKIVREFQV